MAITVALSALFFSTMTGPAGAISGGQAKTDDDGTAHLEKGGFITARIDINNGERSCIAVVVREDTLNMPTKHENSWLMTAASCFADDPAVDYHIQAGTPKKPTTAVIDWQDWHDFGNEFPVVRLVPRPDRDLVLAEVGGPITGNSAHIAATPPRAGETLTVAGYGRTATDWVPPGPTERVAPGAYLGQVKVNSVTATTANVGGDASVCKGDAGGPVYRTVGDRMELVGINGTSWQHGCFGSSETRNGSSLARVDDIYDWIRQQIPNYDFSCAQENSPYGIETLFYSTRNNSLLPLSEWYEGAREAMTAPPSPSVVANWDTYPTFSTSGWTGEIRVGPAGPWMRYQDDWDHPIWEVHRKTGTADPFNDGDLRLWSDPTRYIYADTPGPLRGGDRVATGWQRYLDPAYRNQFTIDSKGRIYAIDANGALREYNWQPTTKTWRNPAGDVIDTGWGKYDSITASGDGVLYARTPDGNLFRFQYDHTANTWTQRDKAAGSGWNAYTSITSPGGDILYGSGSKKAGKPVLRWHRYLSEFDAWAPRDSDGLGAVVLDNVSYGSDTRLQATPNMCSLRR